MTDTDRSSPVWSDEAVTARNKSFVGEWVDGLACRWIPSLKSEWIRLNKDPKRSKVSSFIGDWVDGLACRRVFSSKSDRIGLSKDPERSNFMLDDKRSLKIEF